MNLIDSTSTLYLLSNLSTHFHLNKRSLLLFLLSKSLTLREYVDAVEPRGRAASAIYLQLFLLPLYTVELITVAVYLYAGTSSPTVYLYVYSISRH